MKLNPTSAVRRLAALAVVCWGLAAGGRAGEPGAAGSASLFRIWDGARNPFRPPGAAAGGDAAAEFYSFGEVSESSFDVELVSAAAPAFAVINGRYQTPGSVFTVGAGLRPPVARVAAIREASVLIECGGRVFEISPGRP